MYRYTLAPETLLNKSFLQEALAVWWYAVYGCAILWNMYNQHTCSPARKYSCLFKN